MTEHALTNFRKAEGMTVEEFGLKVDAAKGTVSKWENGAVPRRKHMLKIVEVTKGKVGPNDWYVAEAAE